MMGLTCDCTVCKKIFLTCRHRKQSVQFRICLLYVMTCVAMRPFVYLTDSILSQFWMYECTVHGA